MSIQSVKDTIKVFSQEFNAKLARLESEFRIIPRAAYVRYLSMQYHLTKGVQSHFYSIAGNQTLLGKKSLRAFLTKFGSEEESHYQIAFNDLKAMNESLQDPPIDVELWWTYFSANLANHPLRRLGATCILENITGPSDEIINRLLTASDYLNNKNSNFVRIHRHGNELPHGDEILEALEMAKLSKDEWDEVVAGAEIGGTLYLRMAHWALFNQIVR